MQALIALLAALSLLPAGGHPVSAGGVSSGPNRLASTSPVSRGAGASVPALDHVAVVVMENREYRRVIGSRKARWITKHAHRFGLARRYFAISHPSLPNYLALTGGSTFGIHSDCMSCHVNAPSIASELDDAGISWKAYMEGMPRPCFKPTSRRDQTGLYAKRHNPFFYYDSIRRGPDCARVVPYSRLRVDLAARLPRFSWITPNVCHDMHDCSVATGNRWLKANVPPLIRALGPNSAVFLTWDEGVSDRGCCGGARGGHVPMIVLGSAARHHAVIHKRLDHYALLGTIEMALRVPLLGHSAGARTLGSLLK
jgi:phosphatidylinositol-3-phosphatase